MPKSLPPLLSPSQLALNTQRSSAQCFFSHIQENMNIHAYFTFILVSDDYKSGCKPSGHWRGYT